MIPSQMIIRKRDGGKHSESEIEEWVRMFSEGRLEDAQMAAWLMAVFFRGMEREETVALVKAMRNSGHTLDLSDIDRPKVDKHSTGGVGDKTSMVLAPLLASMGVCVPMISGRGLGHTGGTLDKLESIPGFDVQLNEERFRQVLKNIGTCMIGQTKDIAPADRRMYALRDVTGTIESVPLICGSILSKKLAAGISGLVLDIKVGSGAFMKTYDTARMLATWLVEIATLMGVRTTAILTRMDQPLGRAVGNWLEICECLEVMNGRGPADLRDLSVTLGSEMLRLAFPDVSDEMATRRCQEHLANGKALEKFFQMTNAQGGDIGVLENPKSYPAADSIYDIRSDRSGFVSKLDAHGIGLIAVTLGAGRLRSDGIVNPRVGIVLHKKLGDAVQAGDTLATIHSTRETDPNKITSDFIDCFDVVAHDVIVPPIVIERISSEKEATSK